MSYCDVMLVLFIESYTQDKLHSRSVAKEENKKDNKLTLLYLISVMCYYYSIKIDPIYLFMCMHNSNTSRVQKRSRA